MSSASHALRHAAGALALVAGTVAAAAEPGASPAICGMTDFVATALDRINQVRARGADCGSGGRFGPVPPVTWSDALARAAARHARDMVARNTLSHTGGEGATLADRVDAEGYAWASVGENVAGGYPGIDAVVAGWVKSPGHCKNLMTARFTEVGLACVRGTDASAFSHYWTLNFARPR